MNYQDMIKKKKSTSQGEGVGSEGKDSDVSQGNDKKKADKKKADKKAREKRAGSKSKLAIPKTRKVKDTIMGKIGNQYRNL